MPSLYQLTAELEAMRRKLIENGADEQTIADTLDGEALDFDNKILACAYAKKDLEAIAEGRKEAVREMQESLRNTERQIERLDEYMITAMLTVDRLSIPGKHFNVDVKGKVQSVIIDDPASIPPFYYRTPEPKAPTPVIDKKAIADAIKQGAIVPGAKLDNGKRLVIK